MIRTEMEQRFKEDARIVYHDVVSTEVRDEHSALIGEIERRGLMYPVTVIDGTPVYDGAVSYPAIMRAVNNKLLEREVPPAEPPSEA